MCVLPSVLLFPPFILICRYHREGAALRQGALRSAHLRQLAAQHLHALFDGVRVNGVEPHPEEVSRRRVAEKMPRAGLNQHPGVGGAPGQLLGVDLLRRGQPERVGVFAAGDDAALRQMLL